MWLCNDYDLLPILVLKIHHDRVPLVDWILALAVWLCSTSFCIQNIAIRAGMIYDYELVLVEFYVLLRQAGRVLGTLFLASVSFSSFLPILTLNAWPYTALWALRSAYH